MRVATGYISHVRLLLHVRLGPGPGAGARRKPSRPTRPSARSTGRCATRWTGPGATVVVRVLGGFESRAVYRDGLGCLNLNGRPAPEAPTRAEIESRRAGPRAPPRDRGRGDRRAGPGRPEGGARRGLRRAGRQAHAAHPRGRHRARGARGGGALRRRLRRGHARARLVRDQVGQQRAAGHPRPPGQAPDGRAGAGGGLAGARRRAPHHHAGSPAAHAERARPGRLAHREPVGAPGTRPRA